MVDLPIKQCKSKHSDTIYLCQCAALVVVILTVTSFTLIKNDARSTRGKGAWCMAQSLSYLFSTFSYGVSGSHYVE